MPSLTILKSGLQTTIQDLGRWGWQSQGVSVSGAMDYRSCRLANALVGNLPTDAVLEITLMGPHLEFDDDRVIAVVGAHFALDLDGVMMPMQQPRLVSAGSRLTFGQRLAGARAYLAISGGVATPDVLGSRSTHLGSAIGGFEGRSLKPGDRVPLSASVRRWEPGDSLRRLDNAGETETSPVRVRVVPGPESSGFGQSMIDSFQAAPYRITSQSNRMGFRLEGNAIHGPSGIVSDITPMGTVQVPSSGQPILLMADRQTTGGYPRIAHVITADLPKVAQLPPGDLVLFSMSTHAEAHEAFVVAERELRVFESRQGDD